MLSHDNEGHAVSNSPCFVLALAVEVEAFVE